MSMKHKTVYLSITVNVLQQVRGHMLYNNLSYVSELVLKHLFICVFISPSTHPGVAIADYVLTSLLLPFVELLTSVSEAYGCLL